jgi:Gpi18-like mannosyltransferase
VKGLLKKHFDYWFTPAVLVLLNRALLFFVVFAGLKFFPLKSPSPWRFFPNNLFIDGWARWDSGWYFDIADAGYYFIPGKECNVVFYPLYPIVIYITNFLTHNTALSGIIVSNISFFFACLVFYKLVEKKFGRDLALEALACFLFYPFSFFFSAAYSESTFILFCLLCFYNAGQNKWFAASLWALCASATRFIGLILFPVLVLHYLENTGFSFKKIRKDFFCILIAPLGSVFYTLFLWIKFDDPWVYFKAQRDGWHLRGIDLSRLFEFIKNASTKVWEYPWLLCVIFCVFFLVALAKLIKKIEYSYLLFGAGLYIISISPATESIGRYFAVIFPAFIGMPFLMRNSLLRIVFYTVNAALLVLLAIGFSHWWHIT